MSGVKHLLVKYSLCSLIWKAKKVLEVVIVNPKQSEHFGNARFPSKRSASDFVCHCMHNRRQKRAIARRNDLSLCCGQREVSSVLFGDYLDDGSSQCHGAALCTASGDSDLFGMLP